MYQRQGLAAAQQSYQHYPPYPVHPTQSAVYSQQPPQQPQQPQSDIVTFRHWFNQQLSGLVVNNKTVIHHIAFIAREHAQRFGGVIVQCIDQYIRRVNSAIKLPPFYLVDSICKNIGPPYTNLFAPLIAQLFLDTYHGVDSNIKTKMQEMLVTWRTGGPRGVELFGVEPQARIESEIWGGGAAASNSSHAPTKSQVLTELEVNLATKMRALEINPYDQEAAGHIDVLNQLRNIVQTTPVTPDQLSAIASQLRNLARTTASSAPPLPAIPPPQPAFTPAVLPTPFTASQLQVPTIHGADTAPNPLSAFTSLFGSAIPSTSSTPAVPDVSQLFQSLVKAGIVPAIGENPSVKLEQTSKDSTPTVTDPEVDAELEYENAVLSMSVTLSSASLQRENLNIVSLLYDRLPLQCNQCAQRFAVGQVGKKRMGEHLDQHFRQNRKASQNTGRGLCRSWFVGVDDWVHDGHETSSAKGKGRANALGTSVKAVAVAAAEKEAKLRSSFVIVPPGEEAHPKVCPVCKEPLKAEFVEEEEEWVWKNAINIKNTIYHATCHADALMPRIAARLKDKTGSRSRSATPEVSGTPQPGGSPKAGTKRKAEEDSIVNVKVESPNSTPPQKKQAFSS